jgi:shikimate dehydrogenase
VHSKLARLQDEKNQTMKSTITGKTQLISLLGSPISHSKSPSMQNGVFEAMGLDYVYVAFDVDADKVEDAIKGLRAMNFRGSNVTMPLKKVICQYLDKLTPAAEMAGAVNTIVNDDGVLTGHITDGEGYMMSLDDAGVAYVGKKMTIVGAGGASTAVAIQAAMDGVQAISIFNPTDAFFARGEKTVAGLRDKLGCDAHIFDLADTNALRKEIANSDIFINGTPIGMASTLDQSVIPDASFFPPDLIVTDLIYVPVETKLLKMAKAAGNKTVSGLGMQLFQGVTSFKLWTGKDMPIDVARQILFGKPSTH